MKKSILFFFFLSMGFILNAQVITKGDSQVNLGVGLSGWGIPVYANYEYGFSDVISGGVEGSYRSFSENHVDYNYKYSVIGVGAFANYHANELLSIPEPWDVYAGATLGYYIVNVKTDYDSTYNGGYAGGLSFGGQIGARYYFSDKMGVNLELNGGSVVTGGKLGITIKL